MKKKWAIKNRNGILIDYLFFLSKNNVMKKIKSFYRSFIAMALVLFLEGIAFAQDSAVSSSSTTTTTTSSSGTTIQPWMWIVGGIIVLVIIIALVSGRSKDREVVVTKERTVE